MGRRLLEGLEQRVEGCRREHVDLVDDVHLMGARHRRVAHAINNLFADVVDAGTRRGIELVDVRMLARSDQAALLAGAVGQVARALLAHERLGEESGHGRLARAARAAEEIRVARAPLEHRVLEGSHHVLLTHDVVEGLRTIFPIQGLHAASRARFPPLV